MLSADIAALPVIETFVEIPEVIPVADSVKASIALGAGLWLK